MNGPIPARWAPYLQSVLCAAEPRPGVPLVSLLGLASGLEITRPIAFLLSGEMAVAYFMVHARQGFWALVNRGEPAVLFCFVWLYLASAGAGPWSLDAGWGRGRSRSA